MVSRGNIAIATVVLCASAVQASVLSGGSEFGADTVTIDVQQQLEFLDLTVTQGQSYDAVLIDDRYSGWRHASFEEVRAMWLNAGLNDWTGSSYVGGGNDAAVSELIDLVGATTTGSFGTPEALGITNGFDLSDPTRRVGRGLYTGPLTTSYGSALLFIRDEPNPDAGHWLVRAVPAPGAALSLAVCAGLAGARRRPAS